MKLSARQKKWIKRIAILLAIRIVLGVLLYYAIVFRFRDFVQLALNIETKSAYQFDAGDIDVQLMKGKINMKNAFLHFRDSSREVTYHDIKIPEIQIEVESFKDLIFHGKLVVKNLSIIRPTLATRAVTKENPRHMTLHASTIIQGLKKMTKHLNVEQFSLEDGEFSYRTNDSGRPLTASHVSVYLRDFSKKSLEEKKFLGTRELTVLIKNQHWILPDGKHEVSFKSLLLSVEKDILDIDSLTVSVRGGDTSHLRIYSDRIIMKSGSLMQSDDENGVTIDSVMVLHPVLSAGGQQTHKPRTIRNADSLRYFLDKINIRYLDIIEGQVEFEGTAGSLITTDRADVQIYNLKLDSRAERKISTDSIALSVHDIQFYSRDSLFKLSVGHCSFSGEHLNFEHVSFGPSEKNKNFHGLVFFAPAIQLKNIDAGDLIRKKITASEAILLKPTIHYFKKQNKFRDTASAMSSDHHTVMLQNLHDIIDVPLFHLEDGTLSIFNERRPNEKISSEHIYATVMLNELTGSESKQEMKSAITSWTAKNFDIVLPSVQLHVTGIDFSGKAQLGRYETLDLKLKNGTTLNAQKLTMEKVNADHLINEKQIDVGKLRIERARLSIVKGNNNVASHDNKKAMPFHIGYAEIDQLQFESENGASRFLSLTGKKLSVEELNESEGHISWKTIGGSLVDIRQKSLKSELTIQTVQIEPRELRLTNLKIRNAAGENSGRVDIPAITVSNPVFGADKRMHIEDIRLSSPQFVIIKRDTAAKKKTFSLPEGITVSNIAVNDADIQYSDFSRKDTVTFNIKASMQTNGLALSEGRSPDIHFKKIKISGNSGDFSRSAISAAIPTVNLELSNGKISSSKSGNLIFEAAILGSWTAADFSYNKNGNVISTATIEGTYIDPSFRLSGGEKIRLQDLANHATMKAGKLKYTYSSGLVEAAGMDWNLNNNRSLTLRDFSLLPNLAWEQWLKKTEWQKDYITLKGKSLQIADVSFKSSAGDSMLEIGKITADEIVLTTLKDKRKPFRHGIDKGMPTELVGRINLPIHIDTVLIKNSSILVSQISEKTSKEGMIPVRNLNAVITGISNRREVEALRIIARAEIYDNYIRSFEYVENYNGATGFSVTARISPMTLPTFNPISVPLANVAVKKGNADTLVAEWKGNKYAAIGKIDFYYDGLKVDFLNKKNPEKKTLVTRTINGLAGLVIRHNNEGSTYMILSERNSEKFFITYWVKTLLSGMLTTAGIKTNKKYRKIYKKKKQEWKLNYPEYL